jgi:hypothetical protein
MEEGLLFPREQHIKWANDIKMRGVNLTDWEKKFMLSIYHCIDFGKPITHKQEFYLEKIYAERTP